MKREELVGRHITALPFTQESIQATPFRFDLLQQGQTVISERMFIRSDGAGIFIEMHSKMMPDGLYQSIMRDITDRKKAEKQLEQYRRNLEGLVRERTAELALLNRNLSMEKERLERVNADLQQERKIVMQMMGSLEEANKNLVQAQEQLIQVEKMASLGRLAAGIAHEINNPMSYITTNLSVLQKYVVTISEILELYRGLEAQARAVCPEQTHPSLAILEDFRHESDMDELLLDLKRLMSETEAGVVRVTKIVADLRTFARQEKELMEPADLEQGLDCALNIVSSEVRYHITVVKEYGTIPRVLCYPRQMEQVFVNLLVNAVHSIEKKGTIVLRTYHRDTDVFIEVEDNGCGIPERDLPRIFDPFFTTKEVGQGTGLGLSIVYNVMQNHRGEVMVRSVVGQGTTFILRLPISV
jgi:signal transduction histidine kinase